MSRSSVGSPSASARPRSGQAFSSRSPGRRSIASASSRAVEEVEPLLRRGRLRQGDLHDSEHLLGAWAARAAAAAWAENFTQTCALPAARA